MKKYLFFILIFLFQLPVFAQEQVDIEKYKPTPFISEIEIFGGPSLGFLRGNPSVDNNSINSRSLKIGYTFGAGLTKSFMERWGISVLLLSEHKGSIGKHNDVYFDEATQTLKTGSVKEEFKYDYFSLPVLAIYSFGKANQFDFGIGPYASYLTDQVVKTTFYPQGAIGIEDQIDYSKRWDFGLTFKFSWEVPISKRVFLHSQIINLLGLTNTRKYQNWGVIKTNNTSLLVGIIFKR